MTVRSSTESESRYKTGDYLKQYPDWHAADGPFKAKWVAALLARNSVTPSHLVEIGSGSGELLVALMETYPHLQAEGYDISPDAFEIASPKAAERLTFHHADYFTAQAPTPDILLAIDVFEHVEDYMGFLRSLRPLAPLKVFHIPLDLTVQGVLRVNSIVAAREKTGHLHYFFKETALATLVTCGYEIVDWNYTYGADLPALKLRTRLVNPFRRLLRRVNEDFAVRLLGGASVMILAR